jgi:hypothetical protein
MDPKQQEQPPAVAGVPPLVFARPETAREHLAAHASAAFRAEKEHVTGSLPRSYRASWGTWMVHDGRPCYVLSPYDVPPGPDRALWMDRFVEVRTNFDDGAKGTMRRVRGAPARQRAAAYTPTSLWDFERSRNLGMRFAAKDFDDGLSPFLLDSGLLRLRRRVPTKIERPRWPTLLSLAGGTDARLTPLLLFAAIPSCEKRASSDRCLT